MYIYQFIHHDVHRQQGYTFWLHDARLGHMTCLKQVWYMHLLRENWSVFQSLSLSAKTMTVSQKRVLPSPLIMVRRWHRAVPQPINSWHHPPGNTLLLLSLQHNLMKTGVCFGVRRDMMVLNQGGSCFPRGIWKQVGNKLPRGRSQGSWMSGGAQHKPQQGKIILAVVPMEPPVRNTMSFSPTS